MIARWMIAGFVLWLLVTVAFRYFGETIFSSVPGGTAGLFLTLPLIIFVLTFGVLKLFGVDQTDRAEAASIFALPGLLIGIYEINSFHIVFPNLDTTLGLTFASLMFACYAAMILAGLVSSRLNTVK